MKVVEFEEQTTVYAKNQPQYRQLPAHVHTHDVQGRITCRWRMTWRERLTVLFTGTIWHQILTFHGPLQPQLLMVDKPPMNEPQQSELLA